MQLSRKILSLSLPVVAAAVTLILSASAVSAEPCRKASTPDSNDHAGPTKPGARSDGPSVASPPRVMTPLTPDAHSGPTAPGARIYPH
jgi:hypothetical protein